MRAEVSAVLVSYKEPDVAGGTEDNGRKDGTKGFAGLSALVSDIDSTVSDAARRAEATPRETDRESTRAPPSPEPSHTYQPPPQSSGGSSAGKWIVGVAVVFGLIWLVSLSDKRTSDTSPTYTQVPEQQAAVTSPPVWQQPSPTAVQPSRPSETPPPVGNGLSLSMPQLRYCTAEKIRLDAANGVINSYSDTDIDRFNALVADYNSRCGQFKYRRGTLETAKSEVEASRSAIEAEGRARFSRASAPANLTDGIPQVAVAKPDFTVQAIQRRLNKFGYGAGKEDGFLGEQTRTAISAFQRDENIAIDGNPSTALLRRLSEHVAPQTSPTKADVTAQSPAVPKPVSQAPSEVKSSSGKPDLSHLQGSEKTAIENACSYYERNEGPSSYYKCLTTELNKLAAVGRRPDLSQASSAEQLAIDNACGYSKRNEGPAAYYKCLGNELGKLAATGTKPDLSQASQSEQAAIENSCGYYKRNEGPASYYKCLGSELAKLKSVGAKPDISRASSSEQSAIENACGYYKRNEGPASYYRCLNSEMSKLVEFGTRPDISRAHQSEQDAIEKACGYYKRNEGPASYYKCVSGELSKLGIR